MMPWGAYAGHIQARTIPLDLYATMQIEGDIVSAVVQNKTPIEVTIKKKCRTATLPGSPCAPDRALVTDTLTVVVKVPAPTAHRSIVNWSMQERSTAPPKQPPRLF
ncbi:hypothetical protein SAMN04488032_101288 [Pacificibacter marinus]|uniref:Uncharacterized protein n=2 Tax=Pacificibacter marinus TaxID=658057 RepID=A0A1Y5RK06_9RHOB|nr:hypothetical protein SAMN04488032_101288 [Pacificibacter marinus]SLN16622.1 hypothetical protein PAM7971_00362 [Pacificibacter marinus]